MKLSGGVALEGFFKVEKHKDGVGKVWESEFENVVLDVGWANIVANPHGILYPEYLYLGTGTSEPAATDTGLENVSGTLPAKQRYSRSFASSLPGTHAEVVLGFQYGMGEAEGVWTELGLAYGDTYTTPYNRSLFRDANGNPISLTVLSDEYLNVFVALRMYVSGPTSNTGSFDYNGTTHSYTIQVDGDSDFSLTSTSDSMRYNIWERGFPNKVHIGSEFVSSTLNYDGNLGWSGGAPLTLGPGSEYTINDISFALFINNDGLGKVQAVFDAPVVIPSDHKATFQPCSIQWIRDTVPV